MDNGRNDIEETLDRLGGLKTLWVTATGRAPAVSVSSIPIRTLLDTLGLGLEQTFTHLALNRPVWTDFLNWIVSTAGPPKIGLIDRYQAWYGGRAMPAAESLRQSQVMSMAPVLNAEDIADWERDGVVVLRDAISRDQAKSIAGALWQTVSAVPDDPETWYATSGSIMTGLFQHPAMDVPRRALRVQKAFAQLYGHADLIMSVDRLSFNPPERAGYVFQGPDLHWDANLAMPMRFEVQGILYLSDTASNGGALQVVRGFHHRLQQWLATVEGDPRKIDLSAEATTVPGQAGDLVIWRQELPHGASANRSRRPRLAQYLTMYPPHRPDARPWS